LPVGVAQEFAAEDEPLLRALRLEVGPVVADVQRPERERPRFAEEVPAVVGADGDVLLRADLGDTSNR